MQTPAPLLLIVDDNADIRDLIEQCLIRFGYVIELACDGAEALKLLEEGLTPDLILSDIQMPNVSGVELARISASQYPTIPFLLMSGHTDMEQEALKTLCVRSFIRKPFSLTFLRLCIADALELHRIVEGVA